MKLKGLWALLYFVLGIYFLNSLLNFVTIPESFLKIEKWIIFVGGIFLLVGGVNFLRIRRRTF